MNARCRLTALPAALAQCEHHLVGGVRSGDRGGEPGVRAALVRRRVGRRVLVEDRAALGEGGVGVLTPYTCHSRHTM